MMQRKATTPRYFPSTISLIDTGAENSSGSVRARRSSLIRRMVTSGTTSSRMMAAVPNNGATITSVRPGGDCIIDICGCSLAY